MQGIARAQACVDGHHDHDQEYGVFGDVYVSVTTGSRLPNVEGEPPKFGPSYPSGGFIISKEFEHIGGAERLFLMCHGCPANARQTGIAGCADDLDQCPDSSETEHQLRAIISRLGIQREYESSFPVTTPLWYGLWAVSPVPAKALPVLLILFSELLAERRQAIKSKASGELAHNQLQSLSKFVSALAQAVKNKIPLHVELPPPGHTDFGIYTILPHCPFCKASAKVERWQRKIPSELHSCHVCGTRFSPSATASKREMDWGYLELRETMGDGAFRVFATAYLVNRGETPARAAAIVEATEADAVRRKAELGTV